MLFFFIFYTNHFGSFYTPNRECPEDEGIFGISIVCEILPWHLDVSILVYISLFKVNLATNSNPIITFLSPSNRLWKQQQPFNLHMRQHIDCHYFISHSTKLLRYNFSSFFFLLFLHKPRIQCCIVLYSKVCLPDIWVPVLADIIYCIGSHF